MRFIIHQIIKLKFNFANLIYLLFLFVLLYIFILPEIIFCLPKNTASILTKESLNNYPYYHFGLINKNHLLENIQFILNNIDSLQLKILKYKPYNEAYA